MIKKSALVALVLLPAFFLLHNYNELFGFIPVRQVLFYAVIIYGVLGIVYFIIRRMNLSATKTSLVIFILCAFNLFFDSIDRFFKLISFKTILGSYLVLAPLWILLLVLLIRKIVRADQIPPKIIAFLNTVMIFLFASELITGLINYSHFKQNKNLIYPYKSLSENYISPKMADSSKPDIYFLVFDEYTNNKTLKKVWNFDNDGITNWLATKDFHVPVNTRANYTFTVYSVSSTFNMNYIDAKKGPDGTITRNLLQANQSLSNNETFSILQKENYSINFLAPFKNSIKENGLGKWFDYLIDHQIDMQTLPGKIIAHIQWYLKTGKWTGLNTNEVSDLLKEKVEAIRNTVEQIKSTTDSSTNRKPHFVYGHFMTPHEPHLLFDSAGMLAQEQKASIYPQVKTYTAQIGFANSIMKEVVTYILEHNKSNTIIIVEGDHGFRQFLEGPDWFMRIPDSTKKYFLPNFNAIYFPNKNYSRLYDTMSPVNTFRIVFNQYFNQHFPLLKDSGTVVKDE
jgi:hypothetical protein